MARALALAHAQLRVLQRLEVLVQFLQVRQLPSAVQWLPSLHRPVRRLLQELLSGELYLVLV
jgi:hypothetical protein